MEHAKSKISLAKPFSFCTARSLVAGRNADGGPYTLEHYMCLPSSSVKHRFKTLNPTTFFFLSHFLCFYRSSRRPAFPSPTDPFFYVIPNLYAMHIAHGQNVINCNYLAWFLFRVRSMSKSEHTHRLWRMQMFIAKICTLNSTRKCSCGFLFFIFLFRSGTCQRALKMR